MLLELKRELDRASASGAPISVVELSASLGVSMDEVDRMLDILVWRGDVEVVEQSACGTASACARCPLRGLCPGPSAMTKLYRVHAVDPSPKGRSDRK